MRPRRPSNAHLWIVRIYGIDWTSRPQARKPLLCAEARLTGLTLHVEKLCAWTTFTPFESLIASGERAIMAIDAPFGLPAETLAALGWPTAWQDYARKLADRPAQEFYDRLSTLQKAAPAGRKYPKRPIDAALGGQSPVNVVRPPVGKMLFELLKRLAPVPCGVFPVRGPFDRGTVAIEVYPALVARALIGRTPYKDGQPAQRPDRRIARNALIDALKSGQTAEIYGLAPDLPKDIETQCLEDPRGDRLDAVLCALQGAWAARNLLGRPADAEFTDGLIADPQALPDPRVHLAAPRKGSVVPR